MSAAALTRTDRWGTAWQRPLTRVASVTVAALPLVRFGMTGHALVLAATYAVLVTLAVIDVERRILPNVIVLPAAALVLAAQVTLEPARALEFAVAAVGAAAVLFALFLVNPRGMGMGDVKLALLLGAALGSHVVGALVVASFCALPVALVLLARHGREARGMAIPFGPLLALGAIAVGLVAAAPS
jgi:leader peptidase (prepilin peptidase) / N-methyltransferase